ncbi:hypothetical protein OQA88_10687 [Cercophora sp. LCS_1]
MDVSVLVAQMHDTLSTINTTIASLTTAEHDHRLDELEARRDSTIQSLVAAFTAEAEAVEHQRQVERQEIAERRRREDEERERRRRQEDEELEMRDRRQDEELDNKLKDETRGVEEETDEMMNQVEEEAERFIEEGRARLRALEERRKELNRLIDEQLKMPLPAVPTRARRGTRTGSFPPVVAVESKPSEVAPPVAPVSNPGVKAREHDARDDSPAPAGRSRRGSTPELARFQAAVQRLKNIVSERPGAEEGARPESPVAQRKLVEEPKESPKLAAPAEPQEAPVAKNGEPSFESVHDEIHDDRVAEVEDTQEPLRPASLEVVNNVSIVPFAEPVFKEVQYEVAEVGAQEGESGSESENEEVHEVHDRGIVLTGLVKEVVLSPVPEEVEAALEAAPFPSWSEEQLTLGAEDSFGVEAGPGVAADSLGIVHSQPSEVDRSMDDLVSKVAETAEVFSSAEAFATQQVPEPVASAPQHHGDEEATVSQVHETEAASQHAVEEESVVLEQAKHVALPEVRTEMPGLDHATEGRLEESDLDEETDLPDHDQAPRTPTDWPLRKESEKLYEELRVATGNHDEQHLAPALPIVRPQLVPTGSTTDTDSQVFVTPLASAGFRSPPILEQSKSLADDLDDDNESNYDEDHHDYATQPAIQYQFQEEQATTVHGQDNLFDYDDNSDRSIDTRSHSPFPETEVEYAAPAAVLQQAADVPSHNEEPTMPLPTEDGLTETKADWAPSTSDSPSTLATPPQTQPDTANTTPLSPESPLANHKGLSASRHNPERPQTPPQQRPHSYATPDTDFQPRDVTHIPWHSRNTSTPQSLRSQSTLESSPSSSPVQTHSHGHHDPVIRHSWSTGSGRQRGDSVLTQNSYPDAKDWQRREIATEEITPATNTLFQRMRNVFEQPASRERSASPVWGKGVAESPNSKRPYHENEQEDEGDERSALLGSTSASG